VVVSHRQSALAHRSGSSGHTFWPSCALDLNELRHPRHGLLRRVEPPPHRHAGLRETPADASTTSVRRATRPTRLARVRTGPPVRRGSACGWPRQPRAMPWQAALKFGVHPARE
jgi:hypothetical protein